MDIPALVTGKILTAAAAHLHIYMLARENCEACSSLVYLRIMVGITLYLCSHTHDTVPDDASLEDIQKAVLTQYGSHTHKAMRGSTADLSYVRHLVSAVAPFLVSSDHANSK